MAQDVEPFAEPPPPLDLDGLTLSEAIQLALHNNLGARVEKLGRDMADTRILARRAEFDPVFSLSGLYESTEKPQNTREFVATQNTFNPRRSRIFVEDNWRFDAGLKGRTPLGTEYEFTVELNELRNSLNIERPPSLCGTLTENVTQAFSLCALIQREARLTLQLEGDLRKKFDRGCRGFHGYFQIQSSVSSEKSVVYDSSFFDGTIKGAGVSLSQAFPSARRSFLSIVFFLLCFTSVLADQVDGLTLAWKTVRVSSPVQEIIAEIKVQEGDTVKKDAVLARLRDEKERSEHDRAVKIAEKRAFDSKAATALVADKITSREKALEAQTELQLAQVDVDIAQRKLDEKTIKSPLDGIVVRKLKEEGESADRVEPMFEIVNIDRLYLQFYVERRVASCLTSGQEVEFWITGDTLKKHRAKVDFISPGADPASGLFRIKLLFENPERAVQAGVRVTAEFPAKQT